MSSSSDYGTTLQLSIGTPRRYLHFFYAKYFDPPEVAPTMAYWPHFRDVACQFSVGQHPKILQLLAYWDIFQEAQCFIDKRAFLSRHREKIKK